MKIIFNDATELVVQSATIRGDGGLLIKTISDTEANLKNMFQDQTKVVPEEYDAIIQNDDFQVEAVYPCHHGRGCCCE